MLAGHETTASTMSCLLFLLACNPEEQEAMYEEIIEVIGQEDEPTYEMFPRFERLSRAIKEVLRLSGPVPAIQKQAVVDTTMPARSCPTDNTATVPSQLPVPKGSYVNLNYSGSGYICQSRKYRGDQNG